MQVFEGVVNGHILQEAKGQGGFGYDPVFVPKGHKLTYAEMDAAQKNLISHRALATHKLIEHLKTQNQPQTD
jgi:XTP/dITP diphosphohydrolase